MVAGFIEYLTDLKIAAAMLILSIIISFLTLVYGVIGMIPVIGPILVSILTVGWALPMLYSITGLFLFLSIGRWIYENVFG